MSRSFGPSLTATFTHFLLLVLFSCAFASMPQESWDFLENYGYLPKAQNGSLNLLSNDQLKKAILLMQKYANIPQTGVLDRKTLAKMKAPRCGLPDVMGPSGKRRRVKRQFDIYGPKWEKNPVTWSLTQKSRKVPIEMARRDFTRAFALWGSATPNIQFTETTGKASDISIGFYSLQHSFCGPRQSFDGPGTKLAHAYGPPKGDVHFDDDEDWLSKADGLSLFWTALHEFGHSLGFAHTSDHNSIMFPYYQEHDDNFVLPPIDMDRVRYLYGSSPKPIKPDGALPFPDRRPVEENTTQKSEDDANKGGSWPCNVNIDAIASIRGEIFIFKKNVFWWLKPDLELVRKEPIAISQYFENFPSDIEKVDAVYERKSDQKIMFFAGKQYWLFAANKLYHGPLPLTHLGLPSDIESIDAISNWGHNGRVFIFSGSIYWRMDPEETLVELDYPRDMTVWKGIPIHLDAAFTWQFDSATYFFKGTQFYKFDNHRMRIDANYPKLIQDVWFAELHCQARSGKQAQIFNLERRANAATPSAGQSSIVRLLTLFCLIGITNGNLLPGWMT